MKHLLRTLTFLLTLTLSSAVVAQADGDAAKYSQSYELEARGDYAGALRSLEKMSNSAKSGYVYHLRKGWLLYLGAQHEKSVDAYKKAISEEPKAVEPLVGLMLPQMALRRWSDAVSTGEKALKIDDRNYLAASRLAWSLYNLGRYSEAASYYRQMVELYPSDVEMKAGLAWSLLEQGQTTAAKNYFEDVLDVAPNHSSALQGIRQLSED